MQKEIIEHEDEQKSTEQITLDSIIEYSGDTLKERLDSIDSQVFFNYKERYKEAMGGVYIGQWYKGKEIDREKGEGGFSYYALQESTGRDDQSLKKWHELYKKYPDIDIFIEDYVKPQLEQITQTWLKGMQKWYLPKGEGFEPNIYDVWNFSSCDNRFGIEYPGRIPGQIIQNLLYYYTKEKDIIIDFMAGGGTTYDVCKYMNRICYSYDINPSRDFILKHNLRDSDGKVKLPKLKEVPNLIFVDPPYWSMKKKDYVKGSISELSLNDFYDFIYNFSKECNKILSDNGIFAFLIQNQTEKNIPDGEEAILHTYICSKLIESTGLKLKRIINCPLHTQTFLPQQVNKAKEENRMLGVVRDLLVFKK